MIPLKEQLDADVAVIGGGIAGLMAAIAAADKGARVVLLDKANTKRSGAGATGNDHFLCWIPEKHGDISVVYEEFMDSQNATSNDTPLVMRFLETSPKIVNMWNDWGINMKPTGDYHFEGHAYPGRPRIFLKYDGHNQKKVLTEQARKRGVKILNHSPVLEMFRDTGGVTGVLALDVTGDDPSFRIVRAKAVVAATGYVSRLFTTDPTPSQMFNTNMCPSGTGDSIAQAWRIGAYLVNMEKTYRHAGPRFLARCGKATWIGVYKYPDGRPIGPFVRRPDREIGDNTSDVWKSVFADLMANGTGPAYLDCTEASPEDLEFMRQGMISEGLTSQLDYMDREGIDPARHAVEFGRYEPLLFGRGLEIDETGSTNIKGLYVAGDPIGNFRSGIAGAVTWGWISAENASRHVKEAELSERAREDPLIAARLALYEKLLRRENGAPWQEFNIALQQLMNDYCPPAPRVRSETLLRAGLKYMGDLRAHALRDMAAPNSHTLMRGLEVLDLVDLGEAVMTAARERRETRVQHIRSDCPFTSLSDGEKFINVELKNGRPVTSWRRRRML